MRRFVALFVLLFAFPALAVTQATKQGRLNYALTRAGMPSSQSGIFLAGVANVLYYDTYAELAAAAPVEGIIGYALDSNAFYLRAGSSWVGLSALGSVTGAQGGTFDNAVNNVWTLAENSEDLVFTAGSNLWTLSSSTAATFAFTPASAFAGDVTLNGGAGGLTFGAASSSVVVPNNSATALLLGSSGMLNLITLDTQTSNEKVMITGTTTANALHVDVGTSLFDEKLTIGAAAEALTFTNSAASFLLNDNDSSALDIGAAGATSILRVGTLDAGGAVTVSGTSGQPSFSVPVGESSFTEGVTAPILAASLDHLRFCGNGSNATTAVYMAPVLIGTAYAANMEFGGAGCDGADSTTEATADAVWNSLVFKPVAMTCVVVGDAAGNNDVVTFQLRDDTADVSGMSCTVTMDGAVAKQCTVRDPSPATVALGSTVAVKVVAATDDDLSSADAECRVTVVY